jgi:hypothetical protein
MPPIPDRLVAADQVSSVAVISLCRAESSRDSARTSARLRRRVSDFLRWHLAGGRWIRQRFHRPGEMVSIPSDTAERIFSCRS